MSKQNYNYNTINPSKSLDKKTCTNIVKKYGSSSSKKNLLHELSLNSNHNDSIGKQNTKEYLRYIIMKKDEEILKLKEELNYYKSNYSIQLPNFQKESTSFDACLKLKNKQSLKGNISINQDNTYKAFNSYTKSIFTTPNKKINQNKKINAIKYKYNYLRKKGFEQISLDESKTNDIVNKNEEDKYGILNKCNDINNQILRQSLENIKMRMKNVLDNVVFYNKRKEYNNNKLKN